MWAFLSWSLRGWFSLLKFLLFWTPSVCEKPVDDTLTIFIWWYLCFFPHCGSQQIATAVVLQIFTLLQNYCLVARILLISFFYLIASVCTGHRSPAQQQQTHWQCSKKKLKQVSISVLCCKSGRSSCLRLHGTCRTLWAKPNWGPSGAAVLSCLFS